jgi:hypothetical protein
MFLWSGVRRTGLVRTAEQRLVLVALAVCGFGVCFNYRNARPDMLCILLATIGFWGCTLRSGWRRSSALAAVGFVAPWAGIQLVVYAAVLCGLLLPLTQGRYLRESLTIGAGAAAGLMSIYASISPMACGTRWLASTAGTIPLGRAEERGSASPLAAIQRGEEPSISVVARCGARGAGTCGRTLRGGDAGFALGRAGRAGRPPLLRGLSGLLLMDGTCRCVGPLPPGERRTSRTVCVAGRGLAVAAPALVGLPR